MEWVSLIFSGLTAVAAIFVAIFFAVIAESWRRRTHALSMRREYNDLVDSRRKFFYILEKTYTGDFDRPVGSPETLTELVKEVGVPLNLPLQKGKNLKLVAKENENQLDGNPKLMWDFVKKVYPSFEGSDYGVMARSLIPALERDEFDEVRGEVARFFSAWVAGEPGFFSNWEMNLLKKDYDSAGLLTAILSWLELALVRWTRQDGSGKTGLFRIATELNVIAGGMCFLGR